jgi:hypothetical protein
VLDPGPNAGMRCGENKQNRQAPKSIFMQPSTCVQGMGSAGSESGLRLRRSWRLFSFVRWYSWVIGGYGGPTAQLRYDNSGAVCC